MKKSILSLLLLSFLVTGCNFGGEMRYTGSFGNYVNKKFAQKLADCSKYKTPPYYYGRGVIQIRRHSISILGKEGNVCKINTDDRGILPPDDDKPSIMNIPLGYTKELSEILLLAFEEPEYNEPRAVQKALEFCSKYEIQDGLIHHSVNQKPTLYHYLTAIADFFKTEYDPKKEAEYNRVREIRDKQKRICEEMIDSTDKLVKSTPRYRTMSDEEKKDFVCSRIKNYDGCRYSKGSGYIYRQYKINGNKLTHCWAVFNDNGITKYQNWGSNISQFFNNP